MKLIPAVVRFPADQVRVSAQGREYVSCLCVSDQGEQHRVFGPPTFEALRQLQPGQRVVLAEDSKGRLHLVEGDQPTAAVAPMGFTAPPAVQQQTPNYVSQPAVAAAPAPAADPAALMADQWFAVYSRLVSQGVPEQVAGGAASTCVIQLSRR